MTTRAFQRNATDQTQGDFAARKVKEREKQRKRVLGTVLSTQPGREFIWMELERTGILDRVGVPDRATLYLLTGRRDVGLELYVELQAFPDRYLEMQQEAMERARRLEREVDAVHTPGVAVTA